MKNVCIVSLRGSINYQGMGSVVPDSFCEILKTWVLKNQYHYNFTYHRVELFGKKKTKRDLQSIQDADIIVVISYMEFIYHIKGRVGGWEYRRSWNDILDIRKLLNPKKQEIWLMSSDNRDDVDLYQNYVFPTIPIKIQLFDENLNSSAWNNQDFYMYKTLGNVHKMKVDWISKQYSQLKNKPRRNIDFIYWGSSKRLSVGGNQIQEQVYRGYGNHKTDFRTINITSGIESKDSRHLYLKSIRDDKSINSYFIGRFIGDGFTADEKWKPMTEIIPLLFRSKYSVCFNWFDNGTNLTSRFYECIGSGIKPILVGNYGKDVPELIGTNGKDYYRVKTIQECLDIIKQNH